MRQTLTWFICTNPNCYFYKRTYPYPTTKKICGSCKQKTLEHVGDDIEAPEVHPLTGEPLKLWTDPR